MEEEEKQRPNRMNFGLSWEARAPMAEWTKINAYVAYGKHTNTSPALLKADNSDSVLVPSGFLHDFSCSSQSYQVQLPSS